MQRAEKAAETLTNTFRQKHIFLVLEDSCYQIISLKILMANGTGNNKNCQAENGGGCSVTRINRIKLHSISCQKLQLTPWNSSHSGTPSQPWDQTNGHCRSNGEKMVADKDKQQTASLLNAKYPTALKA